MHVAQLLAYFQPIRLVRELAIEQVVDFLVVDLKKREAQLIRAPWLPLQLLNNILKSTRQHPALFAAQILVELLRRELVDVLGVVTDYREGFAGAGLTAEG